MKTRVLIGLPNYKGEFEPLMTDSLNGMIKFMQEKHPEVQVFARKEPGTLLCDNRNRIVRMAQKHKATHILFIDSDMMFDEDALVRLLKHNRDIVGGLCTIKAPPYHPVALVRSEKGGWCRIPSGKVIDGRFFSDIDGTGAAFLLVKTGVFEKLKEPWFAMPPMQWVDSYQDCRRAEAGMRLALGELVHRGKDVPAETIAKILDAYKWEEIDHGKYNGTVMGEDIFFCANAKRAGFDICLDTSVIIGHIGAKAYTIEDHVNFLEEQKEKEETEKESKLVSAA